MNKINVNGQTIVTNGRSIQISNGKVIIDGVDYTPDSKNVIIQITGNVESIHADSCDNIVVAGDSGKIKRMSGDVEVAGNCTGSVETMSGNIYCGTVFGTVKTMSGNISHKESKS